MSDDSSEEKEDLQSVESSDGTATIAREFDAHDFGRLSDVSSNNSTGMGPVGSAFGDDDRHLRVTPGWVFVDEQNKQKYVNVPIWVGKEDANGNLVFRGDGLIECMEPINRVPDNFNIGGPYFVEDAMFNVGIQKVKAFGSDVADAIKRGEKNIQNFDTNTGRETFNAATEGVKYVARPLVNAPFKAAHAVSKKFAVSPVKSIVISKGLSDAIDAVDIKNDAFLLNNKDFKRFVGMHTFRMQSANGPREYVGKFNKKTAIPNGFEWSFKYEGTDKKIIENRIITGTGEFPKFFAVTFDKTLQGGKSRRFMKHAKTRRYVKHAKHGTTRLVKKHSNKRTRRG